MVEEDSPLLSAGVEEEFIVSPPYQHVFPKDAFSTPPTSSSSPVSPSSSSSSGPFLPRSSSSTSFDVEYGDVPLQFADDYLVQALKQFKGMEEHQGMLEGFQVLSGATRLQVRECQDDNFAGAVRELLGWNSSKVFEVLDRDRQLELMEIKEDVHWALRNCTLCDCRPYKFDVFVFGSPEGTPPVLTFERGTACCATPPMVVFDPRRHRKLGRIVYESDCCNIRFSIQDAERTKLMVARSARCHPARVVGKLPCGSCRTFDVQIEDANGFRVGTIENEWRGFCKELLTDQDNYFVDFGQVRRPENKALLLAMAIYVDMRYFSRSDWNLRDCLLMYATPFGKIQRIVKYAPTLVKGAAEQNIIPGGKAVAPLITQGKKHLLEVV